jgi:hypothetical protein
MVRSTAYLRSRFALSLWVLLSGKVPQPHTPERNKQSKQEKKGLRDRRRKSNGFI